MAPRIRVAPQGAALLGIDGTVGPEEPCGRLFFVDDPEAEVLGIEPETGKTTFARKDRGGWTSYYAITPALPAAFYRAIALAAGVHIYDDRDDVLYANRSYVVVHANGADPNERGRG
ncbi:MAG: hypothetical protein JXP34_08835 [Planctomycetes bacterium]|nr:hypothetical protein [Planctomycetota bacterium]